MLTPDYISKIEGHGNLNIDFKRNRANLVIDEGERLFEGLVLGRSYEDIPFIVSRICGVCPVSHYLSSIKAIEAAFKIVPSETSIDLRKILLLGQIAQSHILHTVFLALPDYFNLDSIMELSKKYPDIFSAALKIKTISDEVVKIVGGRAVHPITPTIGGFTKYPMKNELEELRKKLKSTMKDAEVIVNTFSKVKYFNYSRETEYLTMNSVSEYAFYEGDIVSNKGHSFTADKYKEQITETIKFNSTAKFAKRDGKGFMVGALARISNHPQTLAKNAKRYLDDFFPSDHFPSYNPYHNNFAQAIEIMHCFEEMIILLDKFIGTNQSKIDYKIKAGTGVGAIEAPRGTLYHYYEIDKSGIITDCDIITPTVQNLTNLEEDAVWLLKSTNPLPNKKRGELLDKLIRAYDPCITCSVH